MVKYVLKKKFKTVIYDLDGFIQGGFNRKGFDGHGFSVNGIIEKGFDRNKELVCEEKVKQAIREKPWNIYYASEVIIGEYGFMKECVESDPNT